MVQKRPIATFSRILASHCLHVFFMSLLASLPAVAEVPEPDHTLYGTPTRNGVLVTSGLVTVTLDGDSEPIATYALGSVAAYGSRHVLRLPLAFGEPRLAGTARPGDQAEIYLDGELAATVVVGGSGEVQVIDLDPFFDQPPELTVADVAVDEGDAGSLDAEVVVRLSRPLTSDVHVDYETVDATALAGSDYVATAGRLALAAGDMRATIRVPILGDTEPEPPEELLVRLTSPQGATLADAEARITIGADDARHVLRVADAEVLERDGETVDAVFMVSVTSEAPTKVQASEVTVAYATAEGTAEAGLDFTSTSGVLTIDIGTDCPEIGLPCAAIRVPVVGDNRREGRETFTLTLSDATLAVIVDGEATGTIVDDESFLVYVEAEVDGRDGVQDLKGPLAAAVSPDGAHLYAAAGLASAVTVFERDPASGELTATGTSVRGDAGDAATGLGGVSGLALSQDGQNVYAAGFVDDAVAVFARDPVSGELTFVERRRQAEGGVDGLDGLDGALAVAVAPDGLHVYAAGFESDAVAVFHRDEMTGGLAFAGVAADGRDGVDGLAGASAIALSPGGDHLYVAATIDSAVVAFERDPASGLLTQVDVERDAVLNEDEVIVDGLNGATSVAVSPDGGHVYVAGHADDAVAVFRRDAATGELTWVERRKEGLGGVSGLRGASAVAVSADGGYVFVAAETDSALTVFRRDPASGRLSFVEARRDGDPDARGPIDGLGGGAGLAVSPEPAGSHVYVAGYADDGLAVFFKDTVAPPNAAVSSPSHQPGQWSNNPTVEVEWTGGDNDHGVGLSGYAFLFDNFSDTDPGVDLTRLHDPAVDPQRETSTELADGSHYFHLRGCDLADNCSDPVHLGAFLIDTVAPVEPASLTSTSHQPRELSNRSDITLTWAAASDDLSGLVGYVFTVDPSPATPCLGEPSLGAASTSVTASLADGTWYVHLCAVDAAGNRSPVASAGPFQIDATPPTVVRVETVAATRDGVLSHEETAEVGFTQFLVTFSEGLASAQDPASYRLIGAGTNGALQTVTCDSPGGDDVSVEIDRVTFDGPRGAFALRADALTRGWHRLMACADPLRDAAGNRLDGDGDDFVLDFRVAISNRLRNPNFDDGMAAWTSESTADADLRPDAEDADGIASSGSARWSALSIPASVSALAQCVGIASREAFEVGGRLLVTASAAEQPRVFASVDFYPAAECGGERIASAFSDAVIGDSGGWVALPESGGRAPAGTLSALVSFLVVTDVPTTAEVTFDSLLFLGGRMLFSDGFETGDLSAWSSRTP